MWSHVLKLIPALLKNRAIYGRYLDVFATHAPPWGIHDQPDLPHQGIKAFRWLLKTFKPAYHFHGHIHIYRRDIPRETQFHDTRVINTYGHLETLVEPVIRGYAPLAFLGEVLNPRIRKI
jgi:Icc-related predicted phosphoesterase